MWTPEYLAAPIVTCIVLPLDVDSSSFGHHTWQPKLSQMGAQTDMTFFLASTVQSATKFYIFTLHHYTPPLLSYSQISPTNATLRFFCGSHKSPLPKLTLFCGTHRSSQTNTVPLYFCETHRSPQTNTMPPFL